MAGTIFPNKDVPDLVTEGRIDKVLISVFNKEAAALGDKQEVAELTREF